jgi:hypothetical protein
LIATESDSKLDRQIRESVECLLEHIKRSGGYGYDPYDARVGRLYQVLSQGPRRSARGLLLKGLYGLELAAPVAYRKLRGIPKTWDPMGNSYYAGAHLSLYAVDGAKEHIEEARRTLDQVVDKAVGEPGKRGFALGFPCITGSDMEWSTDVPVAHYSLRVARKFLIWERMLGDCRYAAMLDEVVRFLTEGLEWVEVEGLVGVAYTPADPMQVINIWADVASLLASHATLRRDDSHKAKAVGLARSVYAHLRDDDTWPYFAHWENRPYKVDNSHTGMVVGALADLSLCYPSELGAHLPALERATAKWIDMFFNEDTGSHWSLPGQPWEANSVNLGDMLYAVHRLIRPELGLSNDLVDRLKKVRERSTQWAIDTLRTFDGRFCVRRYPLKKYSLGGVRSFDGLVADGLALTYAETHHGFENLWTV